MKNKIKPLIEELNHVVDALIAGIDNVQRKTPLIPKKGEALYNELVRRHADIHFDNMINSISKGNSKKAHYHASKLKVQIKPVANDYPFKRNNEVYVHRYEHGYEPGYTARIVDVYQHNGVYSYKAVVVSEAANFEIDIAHTRDAALIS